MWLVIDIDGDGDQHESMGRWRPVVVILAGLAGVSLTKWGTATAQHILTCCHQESGFLPCDPGFSWYFLVLVDFLGRCCDPLGMFHWLRRSTICSRQHFDISPAFSFQDWSLWNIAMSQYPPTALRMQSCSEHGKQRIKLDGTVPCWTHWSVKAIVRMARGPPPIQCLALLNVFWWRFYAWRKWEKHGSHVFWLVQSQCCTRNRMEMHCCSIHVVLQKRQISSRCLVNVSTSFPSRSHPI